MGAADMVSVPEDLLLFGELCSEGELYPFLMNHSSLPDKETVKRKFMCDVLAKKGSYHSPFADMFRDCFPTIHQYIQECNKFGREHKNLIRRLQLEEAKLVIETVCWELVQRHPDAFFITLHDAIYTTADHVQHVEDAFEREFERTGYWMSLKVS